MIHIAITINKDFILPASVMLTSLLENNNKNKIHVHILTDTKSFHLNLLKRTISKYNNSYLELNQKDFENYLIDKFKNENNINTIVNYNSNFI